jgi:type IV pilus assembly protein PilM
MDKQTLADSVKKLVKESGVHTRNVVAAFPESITFTRVIEMPKITDQELSSAIEWSAEQYIPMPLSEVKLSWMVLGEGDTGDGGEKMLRVLLVAAPLTLIERYMSIIELAGLEAYAFETEVIAISRALLPMDQSGPTTLIVSVGASTTDLSIVDSQNIQFTRSIGTGGTALTRAISQELGFENAQAEEYKRSYGLLEDQLEGKIMNILKPVVDVIVSEVERAILFYQTKHISNPVKRVVVTGGSAQLPGLVVYMASSLGVEVQVGDPWQGIQIPDKFSSVTEDVQNKVSYSVSIGLAKRDVEIN